MDSECPAYKEVYRKREEVVTRKIAGEVILVPIRGKLADMQRIFSLNPVGEFIWEHLNGERNLDEIREALLSAFDVGREQAEADVHDFISQLLKEGLVTGAS